MDKEQLEKTMDAVKKKKKAIVSIAVILCICAVSIFGYAVYNDDRPIAPVDLPENITGFVARYFPDRQVIRAEIDFMDYEVWLEDRTHIEFKWNRKWKKIETYGTVINPELIPPAIAAYIEQNHQGAAITKIKKESSGYEVKISGSPFEYKFTKSGQYRYMKWDD